MANRLQKLALTSYTPGRPYQPAVPAYCVNETAYLPAATIIDRFDAVVKDGVTYYIPVFKTRPAGQYVIGQVCYPARPAVPAVPATVQYTTVNGWNSGGRSNVRMHADGEFSFKVKPKPAGVVAGIAATNLSNLPSEPSHAFYIHGTQVDLMELGVVVASNVVTHDSANVYKIRRAGGRVTYEVDGMVYSSALPSTSDVALDVSLYASGDFVDSPAFTPLDPSGYATGSLGALTGIATTGTYAVVSDSLPSLEGEGAGRTLQVASGQLTALDGYAADRPYASVAGTLPPLNGTGDGGFPRVEIATGQGSLAPLAGNAFGVTGEIGSAAGQLGALVGQAADHPYGAAYGTLGALDGQASPRTDSPGHRRITSPLVIANRFRFSYPRLAKITSTLQLQSSVSGFARHRGRVSSLLLFGGSVAGKYDSDGVVTSALMLGGSVRGGQSDYGLDGDLTRQALQYAINSNTGAVSQYTDCDFAQFARVDGYLYAVRADGLYLIEGEPAEGILFRADLGANTLGTPRTKYVTDLYMAAETDGKLIASAYTDGERRDYRVLQRGPQMRSRWRKGVNGRTWGVTIEGSGATYFELDSIELVTQQANRIWAGG